MGDFVWSLGITVAGMGTVFLLLICLMVTLIVLSRLDTPPKEPEPEPIEAGESTSEAEEAEPVITFRDPSGLTPDQIAAIAVAVAVHAEFRRKQAAPVNRVHAPGSRLWASRWVAMGRSGQMNKNHRRR